MNCARAKRLLEKYADRELKNPQVDALEDHLARCPSCQLEHASLLSVRRTLSAHPRISASPDFDMRVLDAVMAQGARPHSLVHQIAITLTRSAGELLEAAVAGVVFSVLTIAIILMPQLASPHHTSGSSPMDSSTPSEKTATGYATYDINNFYALNGPPFDTSEPDQSRGLEMPDRSRARHNAGKGES